MNKPTSIAAAVVVGVLAFLAIHQALASREARAALAVATHDRDVLRTRVAELEKSSAALTAENASLRTEAAVNARPEPPAGPQMRTFSRAIPRGRMPPPMAMMDSPEMRELMAIEQKGRLDARYAALFKALRLPPDKLDRLKQLLVDKQTAPMDVLAAAHQQDAIAPGAGGEIAQLMRQEGDVVDTAIRDLLGTTAYEEFQDYERTRGERSVVDQLADRLSYSDAPLSTEQAEALVDLLSAARATQPAAENAAPATPGVRVAIAAGAGDAMVAFGPMGPDATVVSDATVASAQALLSETQLAALRELQAEQQAQQKMSDLFRRSLPMPGMQRRG